jgi:hypothetical protein
VPSKHAKLDKRYSVGCADPSFPLTVFEGYPKNPTGDDCRVPYVGHLINDCMVPTLETLEQYFDKASAQQNVINPTFLFTSHDDQTYVPIVAIREIHPGEELCMFYGPINWGVRAVDALRAWTNYTSTRQDVDPQLAMHMKRFTLPEIAGRLKLKHLHGIS